MVGDAARCLSVCSASGYLDDTLDVCGVWGVSHGLCA